MAREGLAELFAAQRGRLEASVARIVGDKDDAADVVADAFVAYIERGPAAREEAAAWLFVVARNKAFNRVRDRSRAQRRPLPVAEPVLQEVPLDAGVLRLLEQATDRLPGRDARALDFRYRLGLDYPAVAAALGVSSSTARVLVHRAARRLRGETVGLLAQHHRASPACRSALERSARRGPVLPHDGCPSCRAVTEEVHALAARGVLGVPAPMGERLWDNPLSRWFASRLPGRSLAPSPRVAETLAALVVSGGLVMGNSPELAAPAAGHVVSAPRGETGLALSGPVETPIATADSRFDNVQTRLPAQDSLTQRRDALAIIEDPARDSSGVFQDAFALPRLLGLPLVAPDALNSELPASNDIRSVRVGTMADQDGSAGGLYFRLGLSGPPDGAASYNVSFDVGDSPCGWSIWVHPDLDHEDPAAPSFLGTFHTSFSESCSPRAAGDGSSMDGGAADSAAHFAPYADDVATGFAESFARGFENGRGSGADVGRAERSGFGVALEIDFSDLPERYRQRISSATHLRKVEVVATGSDARYFDRAPDGGEVTYQIAR